MRIPVFHRTSRLLAIAVVLLLLLYLLPLAGTLVKLDLSVFATDSDGLNSAWIRTVLFSLTSSLFNVVLSLIIAVGLKNIGIGSRKGKLMAFLLIPSLLGSVSVAFLGKIMFTDSAYLQQGSLIKFISLLGIQFWQFGTLYIYLFWLVILKIPLPLLNYASSAKLTTGELFKDIILPSCRNLSILLIIVNFIFTFFEEAKSHLIFKASRGTGTELISHWLNRNYQSVSLVNTKVAIQSTMNVGILVLLMALLMIFIASFFWAASYSRIIKARFKFRIYKLPYISVSYFYFLLALVILPIGYCIYKTPFNLNAGFVHLWFPFYMTLITAVIATLLAVILGVLSRLGWQKVLSGFNNRSLPYFLSLFFLQLVPPLVLVISGYQWLKITGYQNILSLDIIWIIGHVLLILPLLASFIAVTHFRTSNTDISYLESHKLSLYELLRDAFLSRYKADYLLTFLIAFSLIWNEGIINNILSDFIPSFVSEMKMSITGRSADFSRGIGYLSVSVFIAVLAVGVWNAILRKNTKYEVA